MHLPDDNMADGLSHPSILYLFHHVFLPPKLPGEDDSSPEHDDTLLDVVQGCLAAFAGTATGQEQEIISEACNAIRNLRQLRDPYGRLREDAFHKALHEICSSGIKSSALKSI